VPSPGDEQPIFSLLRASEALANIDPCAGADLSRRALKLAPRDHGLREPLLAGIQRPAVAAKSRGSSDEHDC
jgi:hypothetical protein